MDFVIAERTGLIFLIVERPETNECWTLEIRKYGYLFDEWRPPFAALNGMKVKTIPNKEGVKLMEKYATNTVVGNRVREVIEHCKELPF